MNNMINRLSRLRVGLESAEFTAPLVPDAVVSQVDEVSTDTIDSAYQHAGVALEHACGTYDRLSDLATTLESMAQTDGMSTTESALFNHAVDGICAGTPIDIMTPSMESFTHASDRLRNANTALESVSEKLKAAAEWVKTTIRTIIQKLMELWEHYNDRFARFKETATALKNGFEAIRYSKLQQEGLGVVDVVVPGNTLSRVAIDGAFPSDFADQVASIGSLIVDHLSHFSDKIEDQYSNRIELVEDFLSQISALPENASLVDTQSVIDRYNTNKKSLSDDYSKVMRNWLREVFRRPSKVTEEKGILQYGQYLGNTFFSVDTNVPDSIAVTYSTPTLLDDVTVKSLSARDMDSVLDEVGMICIAITDHNESIRARKATFSKIEALADKVSNFQIDSPSLRDFIQKQMADLVQHVRKISALERPLINYANSTVGAVLKVCALNIAAAKGHNKDSQ